MQRLQQCGFTLWFLVLTDETGSGPERRGEALEAARCLGLPGERVLFAGMSDGYVRADRRSAHALRRLTLKAGVRPAIVATHTAADSHNDHIRAHLLVRAAFRDQVLVYYPIHLSAEPSHFPPRLFISLSEGALRVKRAAPRKHLSQQTRLSRTDLAQFEYRPGEPGDLGGAEAFEVQFPVGAENTVSKLMGIGDSPFHRFWHPLIREDDLYLLYGGPAVAAQSPAAMEYSGNHESAGREIDPEYDEAGRLLADVGVLTVGQDLTGGRASVIGCAGVHGVGTRGILRILAKPDTNPDLLRIAAGGAAGIPVRIDVGDLSVEPLLEPSRPGSLIAEKSFDRGRT